MQARLRRQMQMEVWVCRSQEMPHRQPLVITLMAAGKMAITPAAVIQETAEIIQAMAAGKMAMVPVVEMVMVQEMAMVPVTVMVQETALEMAVVMETAAEMEAEMAEEPAPAAVHTIMSVCRMLWEWIRPLLVIELEILTVIITGLRTDLHGPEIMSVWNL